MKTEDIHRMAKESGMAEEFHGVFPSMERFARLVEVAAMKEGYTEPRVCMTCKHMPKEGYCGKVCIDKNKWEWAD